MSWPWKKAMQLKNSHWLVKCYFHMLWPLFISPKELIILTAGPLNIVHSGRMRKKICKKSCFVWLLWDLDNIIVCLQNYPVPSKFELNCLNVAYMPHLRKMCFSFLESSDVQSWRPPQSEQDFSLTTQMLFWKCWIRKEVITRECLAMRKAFSTISSQMRAIYRCAFMHIN